MSAPHPAQSEATKRQSEAKRGDSIHDDTQMDSRPNLELMGTNLHRLGMMNGPPPAKAANNPLDRGLGSAGSVLLHCPRWTEPGDTRIRTQHDSRHGPTRCHGGSPHRWGFCLGSTNAVLLAKSATRTREHGFSCVDLSQAMNVCSTVEPRGMLMSNQDDNQDDDQGEARQRKHKQR